VLNESGQWNYTLPTAARATKNGVGTYTLPTLNSVRELTVNQGTLNVNANYQFNNSGMFQTSIYSDGSNGRFNTAGIATLRGAMRVVSDGGLYRRDASFDVLTAAGGIAAGSMFSTVELPAPTTLVTFYSQQLADRIRITTEVERFDTIATTENEQSVATTLDQLLENDTSGAFDNLLLQAQNLNGAQTTVALSSLSPSVYGFFSVAALSNSEQYANLIQERMQGQNTAALLPSGVDVASRKEPMRLANNGETNLAQLFDAQDAAKERASGMWLRGFSQHGDLNAENRLDSFDYSLTGATLGYDYRVSQNGTLGVSVGSVKNHLKTDAEMSEGRVKTTLMSLYGGYFDKKAYLNGVLSFGRNDYDTNRNIVVGAINTPVSSSHEGDVFSAALVGGYYGQFGESLWAGPFLSMQYTRLQEEAFSESGSPAALNVSGRITTALVSTLGARLVGAINVEGNMWTPELTVGWLHDHRIDDPMLNASYVGSPNTSFTVTSNAVDRDGVAVGLGIGVRTQTGLTTSLKYNGQFRGEFHGHGLIGELRYEF
jgi:outer membrane autotransporter protein